MTIRERDRRAPTERVGFRNASLQWIRKERSGPDEHLQVGDM